MYVTSGGYFQKSCYNDDMLSTLSIWINKKGIVTQISGAIH
jgi:hypothetical protein